MTVGRETGGPISGTLAACQCQSSRLADAGNTPANQYPGRNDASPSQKLLTWSGAEACRETRFHRSVARVDGPRENQSARRRR